MDGKRREKENSPALSLAGESGESFGVENLQKRLDLYGKAHQRTLDMSDYIKEVCTSNFYFEHEYSGMASRLASCGELLLFRHYTTVDQVRLHAANFCKNHLLCPLCGLRRGSKLTSGYWDRFEIIRASDSEIKAYLVTFTTKNGPDLGERFNHLARGKKKYHAMRRNAIKGNRSPLEINKALGGVSSYEVKIGEGSGEWHVHDHSIWLCHERPWETKISQEWKEITGDSFIVDVKEIDGPEGFLEVMAYAVKFSTMKLEDNFTAYQFLKNKRMVNSFGAFRGVEIPESLLDEPLDDLPYIELLYAFISGAGYKLQKDRDVTREKIINQINEGVPF